MRREAWSVSHALLEWAARRRLDVRVQIIDEGGRALLDGRPVLIACNHTCALDASLIRTALPWRLRAGTRWVVGDEAIARMHRQRPAQRWLQTSLLDTCYRPIWAGKEATHDAIVTLRAGQRVVIMPEGDYFGDGILHHLHSGVAHAAVAADVPILPVRIDGAAGLTSRLGRHHRITLRWRPPIEPGQQDAESVLIRLRDRLAPSL